MKKLLSVIGILILAVGLTACKKAEKTTSAASSSNTSSSKLSNSSSSQSLSSSSSDSLKTESGSRTDLALARTVLYQAGINTTDISDEQILQWWDAAESQGKDFVDYAQSQMQ